jgi:hypothetical protein
LISVVVADKRSLTDVAVVVDRVVRDGARAVRDDECARARRELADSRMLGIETSLGRASRLSLTSLAAPAGAPDFSSAFQIDRYERIQAADVQRVVRATLIPSRRAVVFARADPSAPASGRVHRRKEWLP